MMKILTCFAFGVLTSVLLPNTFAVGKTISLTQTPINSHIFLNNLEKSILFAQKNTTVSARVDSMAIPAGVMSGKENLDLITEENGRPCYTGAECKMFNYQAGGEWGGVLWWPNGCGDSGTPEAWDAVREGTCAINVLKSNNFSQIQKLTFWAKGKTGNEVIEFKVGAPDISPKPGRSSGKVTLSTDWQNYEIGLRGLDISSVTGLFMWVTTDTDNPDGAVFFLDDIQFEGID